MVCRVGRVRGRRRRGGARGERGGADAGGSNRSDWCVVELGGAAGFHPGHDRSRELFDLAAMATAGGQAIADIDTLRHQQGVLGPVASPATAW